ncbi:MAG: HAMP domain-containing sensor histidine kinase [Reichenbachiella sp.]|uniref:sensor histidine kinase n=1 Tax=Reichenbachiella sp. TaxID=2184521 RepID=UPI00326620C8
MEKKAISVRTKYTLGGILFGLSFPIFSQFIDCLLNDLDFNWASIIIIHQRNVIHYVVDTAPIVLGAAGFLLGLTHQKKNDSNRQLRIINKSLDTLTYKITHDLRGPALNIKALTEILSTSNATLSDTKKEELIDKINESVASWLLTFEDFMSLLRHEKSGALEQKKCSLQDTVSDLIQVLDYDIQESGAKIKTDFTKGPFVFVSEIYLNSILKNLITNAIKYRHAEREPEINISSFDDDGMVKIIFSDNGSGIDLDKYGDKLFTLFERFGEKPEIQGSGIGLYLVKDQIEKNNGSIMAQSKPGEGTIFTIHLPITS